MNPMPQSLLSVPGHELPVAALVFSPPDDDPETVRVSAAQQVLFPANPREVCQELGLNWWAAIKLREEGWLSFSPESYPLLDQAQEAELRFVGSLVIAGCDRNMLALLLGALRAPYAFDTRRLYFDWIARRWRVLPDPMTHPEAMFADWLESLVLQKDVGSLNGIGELAQDALSRLKAQADTPLPPQGRPQTCQGG